MRKRMILCSNVENVLNADIINSIIKNYECKSQEQVETFRVEYFRIELLDNSVELWYFNEKIGTFNGTAKLMEYQYIILLDNIVHYSLLLV